MPTPTSSNNVELCRTKSSLSIPRSKSPDSTNTTTVFCSIVVSSIVPVAFTEFGFNFPSVSSIVEPAV